MSTGGARRRRGRDYPPLVAATLSMLLLLAVLPSALNLPQTDPTETLEYAPVPPEDDAPQQQTGNFSSLGLGRSPGIGSTAGEDSGLDTPIDDTPGGRAAKTPSTKRCVGNPPRQTEDPLAPPCVAHFNGDNHGATAEGVSGTEVRVLFYLAGGQTETSSRGTETGPSNLLVDLADPPNEDDHAYVRVLRAYQRYFNERFQTYGRFVHFFVKYSTNSSVEGRRADAAELASTVKPFAVVSSISVNSKAFVEVMNRKRVVVFAGGAFAGPSAGQPAEIYRKSPGFLWSYKPSLEQRASRFVSYVCTKVLPHPVSFSGDPAYNGRARKLGMLSTDNDDYPDLLALARLYREGIEGCGGTIAEEATFPNPICPGFCEDDPQYGFANMSRFQQAGITTVIWAGGTERRQPEAANALAYYPEIVIAGDDGVSDSTLYAQTYPREVWQNARAVTALPMTQALAERPCVQAGREGDQGQALEDFATYGCTLYPNILQLFTGIQVAGPRLSASSMDKGFHAIPPKPSEDPTLPSCFYDVGDYTCVKDAAAMWWDPEGNGPGCFRMPQGGRRYLADTWPEGDVEAQRTPQDPCRE